MTQPISWTQPSLLDGPTPMRIRFEALVDPVDETVVLVVEATQFPSRTLVALQSTPPIPFPEVEQRAKELGREFTALLRSHTGPF